jgi:hypothetical protein
MLTLALAGLTAGGTGCALVEPGAGEQVLADRPAAAGDAEPDRPAAAPAALAPPPAAAPASTPPAAPAAALPSSRKPDPAALLQVVEQLHASGALDDAARRELIANLEQSDPAIWPQLMEYFQASLALRHRPSPAAVEAREGAAAAAPQQPVPPAAQRPPDEPALRPAQVAAEIQAQAPPPELSVEAPPAAPPQFVAAIDHWREHLTAAIHDLEESVDADSGRAHAQHQAALRLLYLIDGQREAALRPLPGAPPAEQEFWSNQLYGLSSYLDEGATPDRRRRATQALVHLRQATSRLSELAQVRIKNLALCTKVAGFGDFQRFERYAFAPGQEVVVYAEVENLHSQASAQGLRTALQCKVQVLTGQGERVADEAFRVSEERRATPRHDFFLSRNFWLPKQLAAGAYRLQLTVEDELGQTVDQGTLDLTIGQP